MRSSETIEGVGAWCLQSVRARIGLVALASLWCLALPLPAQAQSGAVGQQSTTQIKPIDVDIQQPKPATPKPETNNTQSGTIIVPSITLSNPALTPQKPSGPLVVSSGTPPPAAGKWGVMGTLKSTCGGLNANGSLQDPCAPTPAKFEAVANDGCDPGSFPAQGSCWTCPQGYNRNLLYAVDSARGCSRPDASVEGEYFAAKFAGPHCPSGSFHDIGRNECWSCPSGFRRTANAVTANNACVNPTGMAWDWVYRAATFHKKAGCQEGEISDPRNGGECWVCPEATGRTAFAVNDQRACRAAGGVRFARAVAGEARFCAPGQIRDLANGSNSNVANRIRAQYNNNIPAAVSQTLGRGTHGTCWSCPADSKRTWNPVWDAKACAAQEIGIEPAPYAHPGLFGLEGGEAVALALVRQRGQIESIARAVASESKQSPEAAVRDTWDDIARAPQTSLILQAAMLARIQAAAAEPQKATADETRLVASFAAAIRAHRMYMAQTSLDAYDLWFRTDQLARGQRNANNLMTLFDYGVPPPDLEAISAAGIVGAIGAHAGAAVGMGALYGVPALRHIVFPFRRAVSKSTVKTATAIAKKVAAQAAKAGLRVGADAGAKAATSVLATLGAAGPQIIITVAVELIAISIEQIIDIATAKPKLETKLRLASSQVDIARMLQTEEGDNEIGHQWSLAITGKVPPTRLNEFASLAGAHLAAPSGAAAKPQAAAAAAPQFDILSVSGTCLRAQSAAAGAPLGLVPCQPAGHRWISVSGELKPDNARCLSDGPQLTAAACAPLAAGQAAPAALHWDYKPANGQIVNQAGRCLEARGNSVVATACSGQPAQRWAVQQ